MPSPPLLPLDWLFDAFDAGELPLISQLIAADAGGQLLPFIEPFDAFLLVQLPLCSLDKPGQQGPSMG